MVNLLYWHITRDLAEADAWKLGLSMLQNMPLGWQASD